MGEDIQIYERLVRLETKLDSCLEHLTKQNGRVFALETENDRKEAALWQLKEKAEQHNKLLKVVLTLIGGSILVQLPGASKLLGAFL